MTQLHLLDDDQNQARKMPAEPIVRIAEIEGEYRWLLKRAWGAGPTILWCGTNPSIADAKRDDPTMLREIGFSYRWGFGSLIKVNIYPFISPDMKELAKWRASWRPQELDYAPWSIDKSPISAWHHNQRIIWEQLKQASTYVAAWGNGIEPNDVESFVGGACIRIDDDEFGNLPLRVDWQCLDTNADGSPKHTLARGKHRIPDDAKLRLWRKGET